MKLIALSLVAGAGIVGVAMLVLLCAGGSVGAWAGWTPFLESYSTLPLRFRLHEVTYSVIDPGTS